jgi:hypothetical protein
MGPGDFVQPLKLFQVRIWGRKGSQGDPRPVHGVTKDELAGDGPHAIQE